MEEESVSEQDSIDSPLPNVSRWEFYEILGVSRDVDAEELKQKRKKLALRYHPDKNRGKEEEAQEKMQQINRAYEVINNPFKRKLYDKYGVEAVALYEGGSVPETLWKLIFVVSNPKFVLFIGIFLLFTFFIFLSSPILLGLQLDGDINISWIIVFIPLYLINLIVISILSVLATLSISLSLNQNAEEKEGVEEDAFLHETPKTKLNWKHFIEFITLIPVLCLFVFEILLALQLDKTIDWSWWIIFAPLVLMELFLIVENIPRNLYSYYKYRSIPQLHCKLGYVGFLLRNFYTDILFLATTILFTLNLALSPELTDDENGIQGYMSWWIVFAPVLCWIFIGFSLSIIENFFFTKLSRKIKTDEEGEQVIENLPSLLKLVNIFCSCLFFSFILISLILFIVWISTFDYSAFIMFIPVFILFSALCCCCSCIYLLAVVYIKHSNNSDQ